MAKEQLRAWWKTGIAVCMLYIALEVFGIDWNALPFWRQAAGFVVLMVGFTYLVEASDIMHKDG